jgi:hypothetical protein
MILQSLDLMWKGMLSIFIAIGVVYLVVLALHSISQEFAKKKSKPKE